MNDHIIVYLDLGSSKISAIVGQVQEDNAVHIIGEQKLESNDVKNGIVCQTTGAAHKMSQLLKFLQNAHRLDRIENVILTVNARSMHCIEYNHISLFRGLITREILTKEHQKIKKDVEKKYPETIVYGYTPIAYKLDGRIEENPIDKKCRRLEITYSLVIGRENIQNSLNRTIDRTGLNVDFLHLSIEAIATAILEEEDKEQGIAIIDMGATTTTLAIYRDGALYDLMVIPLGGANITSDIQEVGISWKNAELLKTKRGSAVPLSMDDTAIRIPSEQIEGEPILLKTSFLQTIIEARLEEIFEPIFEKLNTLEYPLPSGIVLTGGAAKLNDIEQFIEEKTDLSTRWGKHADWLTDTTEEKFEDIAYAQAIGALLLTKQLQDEATEDSPAMKSVIPRGGWIKGLKDKVNNKLNSLFDYDMFEGKNE